MELVPEGVAKSWVTNTHIYTNTHACRHTHRKGRKGERGCQLNVLVVKGLAVPPALQEDPIAYNSNFRGVNALFWPHMAPAQM